MTSIIRFARHKKIPYLGICLGMQIAVIDFAREEVGWEDATSLEFVDNKENPELMHDVITIMDDANYDKLGGTMRLGEIQCNIKNKSSLAYKIYRKDYVFERHRHRYEVNLRSRKYLENKGMYFGGIDKTETRLETCELDRKIHPFFFGTQYHPEYNSNVFSPSRPFYAFLLAATNNYELLDNLPIEVNLETYLDKFIESNNKIIELNGNNKINGINGDCNCNCCLKVKEMNLDNNTKSSSNTNDTIKDSNSDTSSVRKNQFMFSNITESLQSSFTINAKDK